MRQFLDRLPLVLQAKAEPGALAAAAAPAKACRCSEAAARSARASQLVEATLHHRRVAMRYHSMSSDREKAYLIEPYRLVFAQGGLYVVAFVPEYGQLRTFAVDRILGLSLTEERFEPSDAPEEVFAHSLGVHQGTPPQRVEIAFAPRIARYVKERVWHAVAAGRGSAGRQRAPHAARLERLGAAQLGAGLRPARPRRSRRRSWPRRCWTSSNGRGRGTSRRCRLEDGSRVIADPSEAR